MPPSKAKLPDDVSISGGADHAAAVRTSPWHIENPDPNYRYYFAAQDIASRPDSVPSVEGLGYERAENKHSSPDCVLMRCRKETYVARKTAELAHVSEQIKASFDFSAPHLTDDFRYQLAGHRGGGSTRAAQQHTEGAKE
jgi:hypothetical protein